MHPALADFLAHRGDPLAVVRAAPPSAQSRIIEASLLLCSRYPRDFAEAGRVYLQLKDLDLTAEEEMHLRAIGTAVLGDYAGGARMYDEILAQDREVGLGGGLDQAEEARLGVTDEELGKPADKTTPRKR